MDNNKAVNALKVLTGDPTLRAVLAALDPKALQQALAALNDPKAAEVHFPSTGADWGVVQAHGRAAFESRMLEARR